MYDYFVNLGFTYLQFIPCVERDARTGEITDYSITPEDYGEFLCKIFDEWTSKGFPKIYVRDFEELLISYVIGEAPSCTFSSNCGKYVVIEFNGDVYPCDFFVEPKWLLGNIMKQSIEEILQSEKFLKFSQQKKTMIEKCQNCPWLKNCNGGCPKHFVQLALDHNYFCRSFKMLFEYSHERLLRLKKFVEEWRTIKFPNK